MLNTDQIPKFIEKAIEDTFRIQLKCQVRVVKVTSELNTTTADPKSFDCFGSVELQASSHQGQMHIAIAQETYLNIFERLVGERHTEVNSENSDGIAELLNIIFSSARHKINEIGFNFKPAIPSKVIVGGGKLNDKAIRKDSLFFNCQSDLGGFMIILTLVPLSVESAS